MTEQRHYPQYPTPLTLTDNTILSQTQLTTIYDKYSKLGLYLAPKYTNKKVPHAFFWAKENRPLRRNRDEALSYQAHDNVSGWCVIAGEKSQRLFVIDIDPSDVLANGENPEQVYNLIQNLSPTDCVFLTPSNGVHLYYRVPVDKAMLTNAAPPIKGVDVRGEGGQVVFVGGYNTYTGDKAKAKGVPDGHRATYSELVDGRYDTIPEMGDDLYIWVQGEVISRKERVEKATNYAQTQAGQAKLELHLAQPFEAQERVVKEALVAVLASWSGENTTYDEWLQLWMASHHGSAGSTKIRDLILLHPRVSWSDGEKGRQSFIYTWDTHEHQDGGYTVASLFYLARQAGWMLKTGLEIPDERCEIIDVKYIQDWFDTQSKIPSRLLIQSQTGSGKTHTIEALWRRLGKPKTVIFVPTKKLAVELTQTLINTHGIPATLYRDMDTFDVREHTELLAAQVLVTTLQTFATKLSPHMRDYGLVYIEESDQLIQQFARGGGGYHTSHVTDNQARMGFSVLRDAFENSGTVWLVDATMSMVSLTVAESMVNGHVKVIRNKQVRPKASVEVVSDQNEAYQKVLEALLRNQRVVFVSDTAREAEALQEIMRLVGALAGKKSLVITRTTENDIDVRRFMQDINKEASRYALVCYNTIMASGVSINDVIPDVVVQVCHYLTPRVNLQLLNRYRQQKQVYLYYQERESIYTLDAEDVLEEIQQRALMESHLSSMPISERVPDAALRVSTAAIAIADTERQWRDAKGFYLQLLKEDGRVISYSDEVPVLGRLVQSVSDVRKARKEQFEYIAGTWNEVDPIDNNRPAPTGLTPLQVAQGEVHATIEKALRGNVPYDEDPKYVHDIAMGFKPYGFILHAFLNQEVAVKKAEAYLGDGGRSLGNLRNNVTLITLLAHVGILFPSLDARITRQDIEIRAIEFNQAITLAKEAYNHLMRRSKQKYEIIWERNETPVAKALAFSKVLLAQLGLKQRAIKVSIEGKKVIHYYIKNLPEAQDFIHWRNQTTDNLELGDNELQSILSARRDAYGIFADYSTLEQQEMLAEVDDYNDLVNVVTMKAKGELVW